MTTFQDQPPQSRRALRQERPHTEEIDDSGEATRAPSGRRARAAEPEGLVQVPNDEPAVETAAVEPAVAASPAETTGDIAPAPSATELAYNDEPVDVVSVDDGSAEPAVVPDSAVPKAFPFAGQVEATSDDAGHPGFRLRDFSPELSTSRADTQSAHDWTPAGAEESVPLDYHTQGGPAFGYVSPYAEAGSGSADAAATDTPTADGAPAETPAEPSFDSLFSDLLAPDDAAVESTTDADAAPAESVPVGAAPADVAPAESFDAAAIPVGEPIVVAEPVAPVAPLVVAAEEPTLSRREWRAMRAKAEAEAAAAAAAAEAAGEQPQQQSDQAAEPVAEPASDMDVLFHEPGLDSAQIPPLVEPEAAQPTALSDAMAEFEALTRGEQTTSDPAPSPFPSMFAEPTAAPAPAQNDPFVEPVATPVPETAAAQPAADTAPSTPAPSGSVGEGPSTDQPETPAAAPREPFSFLLSPPATPTADDTDAGAYVPPVGHWSRQAQMDDESQPFENTLSRDVGGGNVATTTNALVLPMIPQRDDFSSVLNATGEIMVTGTINLPGSVGSTGRDSRHYDDPEVDHLFDAFDTEIANTDSAPVRAITAVSSHTATRGGIESGRKQSNRMLNVLLVTACVMAAAVAGLLVAGFVFKIF